LLFHTKGFSVFHTDILLNLNVNFDKLEIHQIGDYDNNMANNYQYNLTAVDVYEAEFPTVMRGYGKKEVNELLDQGIEDYETYQEEMTALKEENDFLRQKIAKLQSAPAPANLGETRRFQPISDAATKSSVSASSSSSAVTNFDILKRISKLERAVFGNKAGHDASPIVGE